jgi:uncharacterized sporulation protein YeaH/YhbH (DUF444 family)
MGKKRCLPFKQLHLIRIELFIPPTIQQDLVLVNLRRQQQQNRTNTQTQRSEHATQLGTLTNRRKCRSDTTSESRTAVKTAILITQSSFP